MSTRMRRRAHPAARVQFGVALALLVSTLGGAVLAATAQTPVDPPSGRMDPPPGLQDYIAALPASQWTFGSLLWQGSEPCAPSSCQAAYNAAPLLLLAHRQDYCCGEPGYSVTIIGRVSGCASVSYYLAWSKDLDAMTRQERVALVARHVTGIAKSISAACGAKAPGAIPTEALNKLFD